MEGLGAGVGEGGWRWLAHGGRGSERGGMGVQPGLRRHTRRGLRPQTTQGKMSFEDKTGKNRERESDRGRERDRE